MKYRIEKDALGEVKVPQDVLWGPQTQRSHQNFKIGEKMPPAIIDALLQIKKAAAIVNKHLNNESPQKADLIVRTINQLLAGDYQDQFPLVIFQTGSGTQTNMNVNEVVAHLAHQLDPETHIHPNDDVNKAQSSNDTFPTAMMITGYQAVQKLLPTLQNLIHSLNQKAHQYQTVVKIGRTHLQDATPITVGQEISGWVSTLKHDYDFIKINQTALLELPIGGTAVGTGLNAPKGFDHAMVNQLSQQLSIDFKVAPNKFAGLADHTGMTMMHGLFKTLATDLIKIGNDIRFLASGPRAGYDELNIPSNEPGSSIMPGKVNPTQIEALTMACAQVIGHDATISFANSQGNFEMNVYKPIISADFLSSAELLTDSIRSVDEHLVRGLTVNQDRMTELVDQSLMLVTALSPHIGYERSAKIAQTALKNDQTLEEAALADGITRDEFNEWIDPTAMTNIDREED